MTKQTEIPGTEAPGRIEEIDDALYAWIEAKHQQKVAADTSKIHHASLLSRMAEFEVERYPYLDPATGKKRVVAVAREPKAKAMNAPRVRREERSDVGEAVTPKEDRSVEHRKVPRAAVEAELRERSEAISLDDAAADGAGDETAQAMAAITPQRAGDDPFASVRDGFATRRAVLPAAASNGARPTPGLPARTTQASASGEEPATAWCCTCRATAYLDASGRCTSCR